MSLGGTSFCSPHRLQHSALLSGPLASRGGTWVPIPSLALRPTFAALPPAQPHRLSLPAPRAPGSVASPPPAGLFRGACLCSMGPSQPGWCWGSVSPSPGPGRQAIRTEPQASAWKRPAEATSSKVSVEGLPREWEPLPRPAAACTGCAVCAPAQDQGQRGRDSVFHGEQPGHVQHSGRPSPVLPAWGQSPEGDLTSLSLGLFICKMAMTPVPVALTEVPRPPKLEHRGQRSECLSPLAPLQVSLPQGHAAGKGKRGWLRAAPLAGGEGMGTVEQEDCSGGRCRAGS